MNTERNGRIVLNLTHNAFEKGDKVRERVTGRYGHVVGLAYTSDVGSKTCVSVPRVKFKCDGEVRLVGARNLEWTNPRCGF